MTRTEQAAGLLGGVGAAALELEARVLADAIRVLGLGSLRRPEEARAALTERLGRVPSEAAVREALALVRATRSVISLAVERAKRSR